MFNEVRETTAVLLLFRELDSHAGANRETIESGKKRKVGAKALTKRPPFSTPLPLQNRIGKNRLVVISFKAGFLYNNNLNILKKNQMKTFIIVFE